MPVTRKVECEDRSLQGQRDGVKGVGVLGTAVHEGHLGFALTPGETAQLAKTVDDHVEASHRWNGDVEVPFLEVLVKK